MLFAYTLIFASFAHLRFPLPIMSNGDEWLVARTYFHDPNQYLLAGILFLLALPALVYAYRAIANQKRLLIFLVSWFLPFTILFSLPFVDGWVLGSDPGRIHPSLIGVPVIVWAVNLTALVIFTFAGNKILSQHTMSSVKSEQALPA
jgi:hypothetical protein